MNRYINKVLNKKRKKDEIRKKLNAKKWRKLALFEYYPVTPGKIAILRGTRHIGDKCYSIDSRGLQDLPVCIIAFLMDRLVPIEEWTFETINTILDEGDVLYKDSCALCKNQKEKLGVEHILRKVVVKNIMVEVQISKPIMIIQLSLHNLNEALEISIGKKPIWLVQCVKLWILVFQRGNHFYIFDCHSLDIEGNYSGTKGFAAVLKFPTLKALTERLFYNLANLAREDRLFYVYCLGVKQVEKIHNCEC